MIPSTGDVRLADIAQDMDLALPLPLKDDFCADRVKLYGNINLLAFRGSVVGTSRRISGWNGAPNRHTNSKVRTGYGAGDVTAYGNHIRVSCGIGSGGAGDQYVEGRSSGQVSENGTYEISGSIVRVDNPISGTQCQVAVVSGSTGYLSGSTNVDFIRELGQGGGTISGTFSLSAARPYVSLICYAITKDYGGGGSGLTTQYEFQDIFVRKV